MAQQQAIHVIAQTQDNKQVIICVREGLRYVFRYAYATMAQAEDVLRNIKQNFGEPVGEERDLAANYWRLSPVSWLREVENLQLIQRTTQKNSWYVQQPGSGV